MRNGDYLQTTKTTTCENSRLSVGGVVFVANVLFWLLPTSGSGITVIFAISVLVMHF